MTARDLGEKEFDVLIDELIAEAETASLMQQAAIHLQITDLYRERYGSK